MARIARVALFLLFAYGPACHAQEVQIEILSRYHPRQIELRASQTEAVIVRVAKESFVLAPDAAGDRAEIQAAGDELLVTIHGREYRARELHVSGRLGAATFVLSVPGRASRQYRGKLAISVREGELAAVVAMALETAVASVVQAESSPQTPLEALEALAVVARSYLVSAKGRHAGFEFCDLAHCQVLRDPPPPGSLAERAARETRGLVLTYQEKPFAAMFTRSCGGRTRTPAAAGLPVHGYPYFSVVCDYCHTSPEHWTRTVSREDADVLLAKGEAGRLAVDRRLGWNAVPSNDFSAREEGGEVVLEGQGRGHGIGLCQRGAQALAAGGANFREILSHYFPNSRVMPIPAAAFIPGGL